MGDCMGKVLAECLEDLPLIESINLNDNNLVIIITYIMCVLIGNIFII